jgi:KaiC/GvpD/RAD55 family RecA-like ATPase
MPPAGTGPSPSTDLIAFLAQHLRDHGPKFVVVAGTVGSGKSSFVRALYPALGAPKLFLLYQQPMAPNDTGTVRPTLGGATTVLLVETLPPEAAPKDDGGGDQSLYTAPLPAAGNPEPGRLHVPEALTRAFTRMEAVRGGSAVIDSWDRESETYARSIAASPDQVSQFSLPASDLGALQATFVSLRVNLLLAVVPELEAGLESVADALIELHADEVEGARVRIITLAKFRGATVAARDHLYSLEGGKFHAFPDLPKGFVPTVAAPDPDPEPSETTIWPGSAAFAETFGRLPHGSLTALTLSPDCTDPHAMAVVGPVVAAALRSRGRVLWMPPPSVRPSKVVALLEGLVPREWVRERLRIVSASGEDPALGDLASVVLPLRREVAGEPDGRADPSPGVGPVFPDAYRFLRETPDGCPAVYAMSIEGLKASAFAAGLTLNAVTLPAALGAYLRLTRFHGFGYGRGDDPVSLALLPSVHTILHMQVLCGRTVIHGVRPRTPPYVMDWKVADRRYSLRPCG